MLEVQVFGKLDVSKKCFVSRLVLRDNFMTDGHIDDYIYP